MTTPKQQKQRTSFVDLDLHDQVSRRTRQMAGLASLMSVAIHGGHHDPERMGAVADLLDEIADEARDASLSLISVCETLIEENRKLAEAAGADVPNREAAK